MTFRYSTGLRNAIAGPLGFAGALMKGSINVYTGTQPASSDAAVTGTLLGTITDASLALTQETQASGTITLATGAAGSVSSVTVGTFNIIPGFTVPFNTSLAQTASDLADVINRVGIYTASAAGAVVTIKPRPGTGADHNGYVVSSTLTTLTATYTNMGSGVSAVNGLYFALNAAGYVEKPVGRVWSFVGITSGTAGWFRFVGSVNDSGAPVAAAPYYIRLDGSIATSGGDMGLSNIAVITGQPNTVDRFKMTQPANV